MIATIEYWNETQAKWIGDGTYSNPCRKDKSPRSGYRVHCFGRWWAVKKQPTQRHAHRVYFER